MDPKIMKEIFAGWCGFTAFLCVFFVYHLIKVATGTNWNDAILWLLEHGPEFIVNLLLFGFACGVGLLVYRLVLKNK